MSVWCVDLYDWAVLPLILSGWPGGFGEELGRLGQGAEPGMDLN